MIERIGYENDGFTDRKVCCDIPGCEESFYLWDCEFLEFIDEIKNQGWKIKKEDDEWKHYCPEHSHFLTN